MPELDRTKDAGEEAALESRPPKPYVAVGPEYDPGRDREKMRGLVALGLLALILLVVLLSFASFWFGPALCAGQNQNCAATELVRMTNLIFTALVGLFGAVTGFYYGSSQK